MAETSVKEFDVTEHIRERVRAVIIQSVPDEAMDKMIAAEYDIFFHGTINPYGRDRNQSRFSYLVQEALTAATKEAVSDWMDKNLSTEFDEAGRQRLVGAAVAKLAPIVQEAFILSITERAFGALRDALNR